MSDEGQQVAISKLARVWMKMRAAAEVKQAELDEIEADMKEVKLAMKDWLLANGSKSTSTEYGTVSLLKSTRYFTNDWPNFDTWIVENKLAPSAMFEHRLAQKNMGEFLEKNPGVVPPGLNSETEFSIRVSKPKAKI